VGLLNEQTKLQERARLVRVLTCSTSCAQELCGRLEVVNAFAGCFDCGGKRYLDEQFQIPRTRVRFGWDAIIGIIPGIGDVLTSVASLVIVHHAWRLGMPFFLLLRMLGNIGIDLILGIVPVAGDALDLAWKANRKNVRLLERYSPREAIIN